MNWVSRFLRFINRASSAFSRRYLNRGSQPTEEPQFAEVVIFYNFVFDVGDFVNPTEVARRLLNTEFSLSAANYLTDDIEVATRFKELARLRSGAQDLSEIYRRLETIGLRGMVWWALRHPIRSWQLWRTVRRTPPSMNEEQLNEADETEQRNIHGILEGTVEFIDEAMVRIQLFEALQRHMDRSLFTSQYLREIPFTRIGLQPFYAVVAGERIDVDVGVLIHRTGVAILTFYVMFEERKSVDELINLQLATQLPMKSWEVVRAIVEPQARALGLRSSDLDKASFERRHSGGVEWFVYRDQEGVTLADVFELYQTAIISAIRKREPSKPIEPWSWLRTPDWLAYPIVFIKRIIPAIPDDAAFKCRYPGLLAGLVQRFPHWRVMKEEDIQEARKSDLSITKDYTLYIEASHATVLYYEPRRQALIERYGQDIPGQEWLSAHFQTSGVIDMLLIQRWILMTLNHQLRNLSYNLSELNTLKRDLLLALEEYHGITLSYGSAQDIVRQARKTMGIDEAYEGIMQKLSGMERLIEVEETRRRTRRDVLLRIGAIIATLLFGLSGAWQVVEVIGSWDTLLQSGYGGWGTTILEAIVQFVQTRSIHVALFCLYLPLVIVIIAIIFWSLWPSRKHKRILDADQSEPAHTPGFTWPTRVKIVSGKAPDAHSPEHEPLRE